jgi:hypothetical protein
LIEGLICTCAIALAGFALTYLSTAYLVASFK